jgi:hypothetical protein
MFNVFATLGLYNDVNLKIEFDETGNVSGILRHQNGYDTPLDQPTRTKLVNVNFENNNNPNSLFMADVQLGYDACVCNYFSQMKLGVEGINSFNVNLFGRSIGAQVPLQDANGNPTSTDFLNMNNIQNVNSGNSGALIYRTLDGMLNDYQNELKKYNENLADYNSPGNTALRSLMGLAKEGLSASLEGLVPSYLLKDLSSNAVRVITQTFDKKEFESAKQWYQSNPSNPSFPWLYASLASMPQGKDAYDRMIADSKKYSSELSKTLKGGLGSMSDALFTSFYTEPSKPVKPSMPTATFTEMSIAGTINKKDNILIGDFYNPGSYKFNAAFSGTSYPIYNEPVGLFALLETPQLIVFKELNEVQTKLGNLKTQHSLFLKLKSPLKYRFNHAVDIDFKKTQVHAQIEIEYYLKGDVDLKKFNLKTFHSIPDGAGVKSTFVSDWYPIEMFGEKAFGIDHNFFHLDISTEREIKIKKVVLKLMADMYFLSPGYAGKEKNTTQVFSYLLYKDGIGEDKVDFIETKGSYVANKSDILSYSPSDLTLENEVIGPNDRFISEVVGNTLFLNYENIFLKGNISVMPGYVAKLQAFWDIDVAPNAMVNENIELAIKRNFYQFPEAKEVTDIELEAFCKLSSGKYQSNLVLGKSQIKEPIYKEEAAQISFKIYPNPGKDIITIEGPFEIYNLEILDVNGKLVEKRIITSIKAQLNISNLSAGFYGFKLIDFNGKIQFLKFVKLD